MKEKKLRHQFSLYKVVDNIYVRRCYKCCGFNHIAANCKNKIACSRCAGDHKYNECKERKEKCINCMMMNEKLKMNLKINHNAWAKECIVYKRKVESSKKALDNLK